MLASFYYFKKKTSDYKTEKHNTLNQPKEQKKIIDSNLIDEILNLLTVIDRKAKISSSLKSEEWLKCDKRLREIGEQLYSEGGESEMKLVFQLVYIDKTLRDHYLSDAWDHVGSWMT